MIRILLVEDNPAEAFLAREALAESGVEHWLDLVRNGNDATSFLRRESPFSNAIRPDLVFLDLNLPGKDGRQVLSEIKSDPSISGIPVIVVTNSAARQDIEHVYRLNGNCYLVKPPDVEDYYKMMRKAVEFWWYLAQLPENSGQMKGTGNAGVVHGFAA